MMLACVSDKYLLSLYDIQSCHTITLQGLHERCAGNRSVRDRALADIRLFGVIQDISTNAKQHHFNIHVQTLTNSNALHKHGRLLTYYQHIFRSKFLPTWKLYMDGY